MLKGTCRDQHHLGLKILQVQQTKRKTAGMKISIFFKNTEKSKIVVVCLKCKVVSGRDDNLSEILI